MGRGSELSGAGAAAAPRIAQRARVASSADVAAEEASAKRGADGGASGVADQVADTAAPLDLKGPGADESEEKPDGGEAGAAAAELSDDSAVDPDSDAEGVFALGAREA